MIKKRNIFISLFIIILLLKMDCLGEDRRSHELSSSEQSNVSLNETEQRVRKKPYLYKIKGRRDPFMPYSLLVKAKAKSRRNLHPLEKYELSKLNVIGIVYDGNKYTAAIVVPTGKAFNVKKGRAIGFYDGKIVDIQHDRIIVKEQFTDYRGKKYLKETALKLRSGIKQ